MADVADVAVDVAVDVEADGCFRCILSLKLPSFVGNFRLNTRCSTFKNQI